LRKLGTIGSNVQVLIVFQGPTFYTFFSIESILN
jgi:hypothetical protein